MNNVPINKKDMNCDICQPKDYERNVGGIIKCRCERYADNELIFNEDTHQWETWN